MHQVLSSASDKARIFYLFFFSFIGLFMAGGLSELLIAPMAPPEQSQTIWTIRLNGLLQATLMFLLPAITTFAWSYKDTIQALKLKPSHPTHINIIFATIIFVAIYPFTTYLTQLNKALKLPQSMSAIEQWMRQNEDFATNSTNILFADTSIVGIIINILIIAIVASVAEELFFRGALQQLLRGALKNAHLAIWTTALIFSAIHVQFYGFLPRLILGATLGYLFHYTQNLWVPIFVHALNNLLVISILTFRNFDPDTVSMIENIPPTTPLYIIFALASVLLTIKLFIVYKAKINKT